MSKHRYDEYLYYEFRDGEGLKIYKEKDSRTREDDERFECGNYFNPNHLWRVADICNRINNIFEEFKYANV